MSNAILNAQSLARIYHQGENDLKVFENLSLTINKGEIVALVGASGSGKSTLLQILGLLDRPTNGQIHIDGIAAHDAGDEERTLLRRHKIGFIYQFHFLQAEFSAVENVMIPQMISGKSASESRRHAEELLNSVGLSHRYEHRPARLSGGEQQRVAIARALVNGPHILLADEPTGNLDPDTSRTVFEALIKMVRQTGSGAIIATHNLDLADQMDRIIELKQGRIISY